MAIGGGLGDACSPGRAAQRHAERAVLVEQLRGCDHQGAAQVPVVVAPAAGGARHGAVLRIDVDTVNILMLTASSPASTSRKGGSDHVTDAPSRLLVGRIRGCASCPLEPAGAHASGRSPRRARLPESLLIAGPWPVHWARVGLLPTQ